MMMRPIEENGVRKVDLNGQTFNVDELSDAPNDLKRRWDVCCAHIERGDDMSGAIKVLTREALEHFWSKILMRSAHANPQHGGPGLAEKAAVRLKAPAGRLKDEVWTATGRRLRPDGAGEITVSNEEAKPLLANGWTIVS
jgi:hypothetical protein